MECCLLFATCDSLACPLSVIKALSVAKGQKIEVGRRKEVFDGLAVSCDSYMTWDGAELYIFTKHKLSEKLFMHFKRLKGGCTALTE